MLGMAFLCRTGHLCVLCQAMYFCAELFVSKWALLCRTSITITYKPIDAKCTLHGCEMSLLTLLSCVRCSALYIIVV